MYAKKITGYVVGAQDSGIGHPEKSFDRQQCRVFKTGHVLTLREERTGRIQKSAGIASIANKGLDYYQVISNQGACERCLEHSGAIYPVAKAKNGDNLPPFHPNCLCTIAGIGTDNPHDDPWLGETIFWLDIMYGDGTMEQKAQKALGFYHWTEFSVEFIANALSAVDRISHIGKRMEAFFNYLENPSAVEIITSADLQEFGWHTATQDEAARLMAAFAKFGITSRESMIQFMAIAMAESGNDSDFLEDGSDAYFESNGYDRNTRGAGYIQVTGRKLQQAFLDFIGDDYSGADTASYIAEHYPLEASVWWWSNIYMNNNYQNGVNGFIETKLEEGGEPLLIFLRTAYYAAGSPGGSFSDDMEDAIAGKTDYEITDDEIIINGRKYPLPSRWEARVEAYEKAQEIW